MTYSTSPSVSVAVAHPFRDVIYWIATLLAATAFVVPGILNLVHAPHMVQDMAHLGYPSYFPTILGAWKVLGALAIVLPGRPRLKEWAYAGMVFDLTGAAISRAVIGDGALMVLVPLVIAAIVGTSWALRPAPRRLSAVYA
jgi:hypothetical protein